MVWGWGNPCVMHVLGVLGAAGGGSSCFGVCRPTGQSLEKPAGGFKVNLLLGSIPRAKAMGSDQCSPVEMGDGKAPEQRADAGTVGRALLQALKPWENQPVGRQPLSHAQRARAALGKSSSCVQQGGGRGRGWGNGIYPLFMGWSSQGLGRNPVVPAA